MSFPFRFIFPCVLGFCLPFALSQNTCQTDLSGSVHGASVFGGEVNFIPNLALAVTTSGPTLALYDSTLERLGFFQFSDGSGEQFDQLLSYTADGTLLFTKSDGTIRFLSIDSDYSVHKVQTTDLEGFSLYGCAFEYDETENELTAACNSSDGPSGVIYSVDLSSFTITEAMGTQNDETFLAVGGSAEFNRYFTVSIDSATSELFLKIYSRDWYLHYDYKLADVSSSSGTVYDLLSFKGTIFTSYYSILVCGPDGLIQHVDFTTYPPLVSFITDSESDSCYDAMEFFDTGMYLIQIFESDEYDSVNLWLLNSDWAHAGTISLDTPYNAPSRLSMAKDDSSQLVFFSSLEYGISTIDFSLGKNEAFFEQTQTQKRANLPVSFSSPYGSNARFIGYPYGLIKRLDASDGFSELSSFEIPGNVHQKRSHVSLIADETVLYSFLDTNYAVVSPDDNDLLLRYGEVENKGCNGRSAFFLGWKRGERLIVTCEAVYNLNTWTEATLTRFSEAEGAVSFKKIAPLNGTQWIAGVDTDGTLWIHNWVTNSFTGEGSPDLFYYPQGEITKIDWLVRDTYLVVLEDFDLRIIYPFDYGSGEFNFDNGLNLAIPSDEAIMDVVVIQGSSYVAIMTEYNTLYLHDIYQNDITTLTYTITFGFLDFVVNPKGYRTMGMRFLWNKKLAFFGNWGYLEVSLSGLCSDVIDIIPSSLCPSECNTCSGQTCFDCKYGSSLLNGHCFFDCDDTSSFFDFPDLKCQSQCSNGYGEDQTFNGQNVCIPPSIYCSSTPSTPIGLSDGTGGASDCISLSECSLGVNYLLNTCESCKSLFNSTLDTTTGYCSSSKMCLDSGLYFLDYSGQPGVCAGSCEEGGSDNLFVHLEDSSVCFERTSLIENPGAEYYAVLASQTSVLGTITQCVSDNGGFMEDEICVDAMPSSCRTPGDDGEDLFYLEGYGCLEEILCRFHGGIPDKEGNQCFSDVTNCERQSKKYDYALEKCVLSSDACGSGTLDNALGVCTSTQFLGCSLENPLVLVLSESSRCISHQECYDMDYVIDGETYKCVESCSGTDTSGLGLCCENECGADGCFASGRHCCPSGCAKSCYATGPFPDACCHPSCGLCRGPTNEQCLTCADGRKLDHEYCCHETCVNTGLACYGTSDDECCHQTCSTCSGGGTFSDCLSCHVPRHFYSDYGICCGQYCKTCSEPDFCSSCYSDNPSLSPEGHCCNSECSECLSDDPGYCFSCNEPWALYGNSCVYPCPGDLEARFDQENGGYVCCGHTCQTCEHLSDHPEICVTCYSPAFSLLGKDGTCFSDCLVGQFFYTSETIEICSDCDSSCSTCDGPTSTECLTCFVDNYLFFVTEPSGYCSNTCASIGYFTRIESGVEICEECHSTCSTCQDSLASSCLTCHLSDYLTGYFYSDTGYCVETCRQSDSLFDYLADGLSKCAKCDGNCQTCYEDKTICTSCNGDFFLYSDNICQENCSDGYFSSIEASSPDPDFSDLVSWCFECSNSCRTCSDTSDYCVTCYSDAFMLYGSDGSGGTCVSDCNDGFFEFSALPVYGSDEILWCRECSSNCETCMDSPETCTTCTDEIPYMLIDNTCEAECLSSAGFFFYFDSSIDPEILLDIEWCADCNENCLTCSGTSDTCTSCVDNEWLHTSDSICKDACDLGYFDFFGDIGFGDEVLYCEECDASCVACEDYSYWCTECEDGYLIKSDYHCVSDCGEAFYVDDSNTECNPCDFTCKYCSGPDENECTDCYDFDYFFDEGYCVYDCPDGWYIEGGEQSDGRCRRCQRECASCMYTSDFCIECSDSTLYVTGSGECISDCFAIDEVAFYDDGVLKCFDCDPSCESCLSDDPFSCESCASGYYSFFGSSCLSDCSSMGSYYGDIIEGERVCVPCSLNCETCTGFPEICVTCYSDEFLDADSKCVSSCPYSDGLFTKINSNGQTQCLECNPTCQTCSSKYVCESCSDGWSLTVLKSCVSSCPDGYYTYTETNGSGSQEVCVECNDNCATCKTNPAICTSCPNSDEFVYETSRKCISGCSSSEFLARAVENAIQIALNVKDPQTIAQSALMGSPGSMKTIGANEHAPKRVIGVVQTRIHGTATSALSFARLALVRLQLIAFHASMSTISFNSMIIHILFAFIRFSLLTDGSCFYDCGDGFFLELSDDLTPRCTSCSDRCLTCTEFPDCTECMDGYFETSDGQCWSTCDSGFYQTSSDGRVYCLECSNNCLTCEASEDTCTSCSDGHYLYENGFCSDTCPSGMFVFSSNGVSFCEGCSSECATCQEASDTCLTCDSGFLLYDYGCYTKCPDSSFFSGGECQDCSSKCQTCSSFSVCTSCHDDHVLLASEDTCINSARCPLDHFILDEVCSACSDNCYTCEGSSTKCTTCQSGDILIETTSFCSDQCPEENFYLNQHDDGVVLCSQCVEGCNCFQRSDYCTSCMDGYALYNSDCVLEDECPDGFYLGEGSSGMALCLECYSNCLKCNGADSCTSCDEGFSLLDSFCYEVCPDGMYEDSKGKCQDCRSTCETCTESNTCETCPSTRIYMRLPDKTCQSSCSEVGYFKADYNKDSSTLLCQQCDSKCYTCDGPDQNDCLSCSDEFPYLTTTGKCSDSCEDDEYVSDGFTCGKCHVKCEEELGCSGPLSEDCLECYDGCASCTNTGRYDCVTCASDFYMTPSGSCVATCPDGTYQDGNECVSCNDACETCSGAGVFNCITCADGYDFGENGYCKKTVACPNSCSKCIEDSTDCYSCKTGYNLTSSATCIDCRSTGYFSVNLESCSSCDPSCETCYGPSSGNCLTCQPGLFFYSNECLDSCPESTFALNSDFECFDCAEECASCYGSENDECFECNRDYYPIEVGIVASWNQGSSSSSSSDSLTVFKCIQRCSNGYYYSTSSFSCKMCTSNCDECASSTECSVCKSGYHIYGGKCYSTCPSGTFASDSTCSLCSTDCETCSSFSTCTSCSGTKFLSSYSTCLDECPSSMIANQQKMTCQECISPFVLFYGVCYKCSSLTGLFSDNLATTGASVCSETCGDGRIYRSSILSNLSNELECDDGNEDDNDGCSSKCQIEDGWDCQGGTYEWPDICIEESQVSQGNSEKDPLLATSKMLQEDGTEWAIYFNRELALGSVAPIEDLITVSVENLSDTIEKSIEVSYYEKEQVIHVTLGYDDTHHGGELSITFNESYFFDEYFQYIQNSDFSVDLPAYYNYTEAQEDQVDNVKVGAIVGQVVLYVESGIVIAGSAVFAGLGVTAVNPVIWSLISVTQLINYFGFMDIGLPGIYDSFAGSMDLGRFEFIGNPFEATENNLGFDVSSSSSRFLSRNASETIDINDNMPPLLRDLGFSAWFLLNLGQFVIIYPILILFVVAFILLSKVSYFHNKKIGLWIMKVRVFVEWGLLIKFFRFTSIELILFSFIQFAFGYSDATAWGIFNLVLAIFSLAFCLIFTLAQVLAIASHKELPINYRWQAFFDEFYTHTILGQIFPVLITLKNLLLAGIIVFLWSDPVAQLWLLLFLFIGYTAFHIPVTLGYKWLFEAVVQLIVNICICIILALLLNLAYDNLKTENYMSTTKRIRITWGVIGLWIFILILHFLMFLVQVLFWVMDWLLNRKKRAEVASSISKDLNKDQQRSIGERMTPRQDPAKSSDPIKTGRNLYPKTNDELPIINNEPDLDEWEILRRKVSRAYNMESQYQD